MNKRISLLDNLLSELNSALNTVSAVAPKPVREAPTAKLEGDDVVLSAAEKAHAAGLMRVNHSGEVCAQALYKGQALTAKLPEVRQEMEQAAIEEQDHLAWCEQRIGELGGHTSVFNPLWYSLSFGMGAAAGLVSDKLSLGFVAATEDQVCEHLASHLSKLPKADQKSHAIVQQMYEDEARHATAALQAGGYQFPQPVKKVMSLVSVLMTKSSYRV